MSRFWIVYANPAWKVRPRDVRRPHVLIGPMLGRIGPARPLLQAVLTDTLAPLPRSTPKYKYLLGLVASAGFRAHHANLHVVDPVPSFEKAPPEVQEILGKPIRELGLKLEGSPLERFVQQLYRELEAKGLKKFRPLCYLTDEWGCPSGEPVIGIPFYLADPKLARLEKEMNDLEDSRQIMMYLRHEAGHAINYAYALYKTPEWKELFGPFRRPYRDQYRPVPFSRSFVRHMEGWYAQKHPDEDFAETFAVWLTPRSRWRERYKNWPALQKLRYVDRIARKLGVVDPVRAQGDTDITVEEMDATVGEFYERALAEQPSPGELALDTDLEDIFNVSPRKRKGVRPAVDLLRENRQSLVSKLTYWTGVQRPLVRKLIESIEDRVGELQLKAEIQREKEYLTEVTVYATALAMNYVTRGKFVPTEKKGTRNRERGTEKKGTGNRLQGTGKPEEAAGLKVVATN